MPVGIILEIYFNLAIQECIFDELLHTIILSIINNILTNLITVSAYPHIEELIQPISDKYMRQIYILNIMFCLDICLFLQ